MHDAFEFGQCCQILNFSPILGNPETLKNFSGEKLLLIVEFYVDYYFGICGGDGGGWGGFFFITYRL